VKATGLRHWPFGALIGTLQRYYARRRQDFDLVVRRSCSTTRQMNTLRGGMTRRASAAESQSFAYDRLRAIVYASGTEGMSADVTAIVAEMEFRKDEPGGGHLLRGPQPLSACRR
jgi:hypothetical protein